MFCAFSKTHVSTWVSSKNTFLGIFFSNTAIKYYNLLPETTLVHLFSSIIRKAKTPRRFPPYLKTKRSRTCAGSTWFFLRLFRF
jgi:hypothetical protein